MGILIHLEIMFKSLRKLIPNRSTLMLPRSCLAFSTGNKESIDFGFKTVERDEK